MREIKFRAWYDGKMHDRVTLDDEGRGIKDGYQWFSEGNTLLHSTVMQYTGLKDKAGVTEVYEGDIIDESGLVVGNIYEMDKRKTDFIIQGFGAKAWCETYRRAILLGCKDAE